MKPSSHLLVACLFTALLTLTACADEPAEPDEVSTTVPAENAQSPESAPAEMTGEAARVGVAQQEPYGTFLTDGDGRTLYLFTADTQGQSSACYDACADAWPPLTTTAAPEAADPAVQASMLETITRQDGSMQVTYNGWPLYYFQQDQEAGQVSGQDIHSFGGEWYLLAPSGQQIEAEAEAEAEGY